jgi:hypothetical protein
MTTTSNPRRVPRAATWLAAAAVAAFAASTAPQFGDARGPILRVLVQDASASCGARADADADELAALLDGLDDDDRVAFVSFGEDVRSSPHARKPSAPTTEELRRPASPHGSALGDALLHAASLASESDARTSRLEIVLATDGLSTDAPERVAEGARALRARNCASLRVLKRRSVATPSAVAELRGPGAARVGEPFALEARGVATSPDAVVEIADAAGVVVETRRVGGAGVFRLAFTRIEESEGTASFSARVAGTKDVPAAVARVAVTSPGRALVVGAARREIPGLDAAWRDVRDVRGDDASALFAVNDAVVLDDLRSPSVDEFVEPLRRFVERGGGVVLLGGPDSFGAGAWAGRRIEAISPLVARPHDEKGTFLYLALDGSGSMGAAWSAAPGAATRDAVVRGAAKALVWAAADDATIALRRFSYDLTPPGSAAVSERAAVARDRLVTSVDALPQPGGSTALLPPLREALSLAAARGERRKHALVLTDGRTAERAEDLHAALAALDAADVGVTFVLPGEETLDEEARSLKAAIVGTRAQVRGAATPERLADVFRDVEEKTRVDEPVVAGRRLVVDAGAAGLVDAAPESAARVDRVWLADGARLLVVTDQGEPVAAIRRVGLGTATALATRPGDAEWLAAGETTSRLVASLVRAAMRPAAGRARVERDGETRLLVRYEPPPGGDVPAFAERGGLRAPLAPAGDGLHAAEFAAAGRPSSDWIDLVAADGRVIASAGLDTPAPAEYRDPPPVDLDALAASACGAAPPASKPLLPWLAAAAVALALAGIGTARIKSEARVAR